MNFRQRKIDMRNVLILHREDLQDRHVLDKVEDIYMSMCKIYTGQRLETADIVIFYFNLTNKYKILKNRDKMADNHCGGVETPEDENMLLSYFMGTI